jgi:hypothetical protein
LPDPSITIVPGSDPSITIVPIPDSPVSLAPVSDDSITLVRGSRDSDPSITLVRGSRDSDPSITLVRGSDPSATMGLSPAAAPEAEEKDHGVLVTDVSAEATQDPSSATLRWVGPGGPNSFYLRSTSSPKAAGPEEIDHAFFARAAEATAQLQAEAPEVWVERDPRPAPSPEVLARRGRLRGLVGMVVGVFALMAGPIAGQALGFSHPHDWSGLPAVSVHAASRPATMALAAEEEDESPAPEGARGAQAAAVAPSGSASSVPEPPAARAAAPDPARARELSTRALGRLEAGKYREAIELATEAIEADPTDADPYLYKATALLETGKHAEARAVFARCVEQATRGQKQECRHFQSRLRPREPASGQGHWRKTSWTQPQVPPVLQGVQLSGLSEVHEEGAPAPSLGGVSVGAPLLVTSMKSQSTFWASRVW